MMPAEVVIEVLDIVRDIGVDTWVGGGWGVDALLHRQTRPHRDLNLIICGGTASLLSIIKYSSFNPVPGGSLSQFSLRDDADHTVVVNIFRPSVEFTHKLQDPYGRLLDADVFAAVGQILQRPVPCLSVASQLQLHTGYELREDDFQDVAILCRHFQIPLPFPYNWSGLEEETPT